MPPWGRPSWGRNGGDRSSGRNRRRKEWERQQREWEATRRFEELDSDSDFDEGVDLDYREEDSYSDESESNDDYQGDMQIALRDKENVLVSRAMARIRRAQELGKENVKLTPAESEALERKMAKDRAKGRKPIIETERVPAKKASRRSLPTSSGRTRGDRLSFGQEEQHSKSQSRRASSNNLQQLNPPRRRPLPDDPAWRPRSSSSLQALPYPTSPQDDHRYDYPVIQRSGPSRHTSGPPEVHYPPIPPYPTNMPNPRAYASSSDPSLSRRAVSGSSIASRRREIDSDDDSEDDDDDADQGVQVDVIPSSSAQGYEVVSRNQGAGYGGRTSQTASLGRRRGGKR